MGRTCAVVVLAGVFLLMTPVQAQEGPSHGNPDGTEPAADGGLKPYIITIEGTAFGGRKDKKYRPEKGSLWDIPSGWYQGISGDGSGYAVLIGHEWENPPGHNCTGLQMKWWEAGAAPDEFYTETSEAQVLSIKAWQGGGTFGNHLPGILKDGTTTVELYCTSCPCMCASSSFSIRKVP